MGKKKTAMKRGGAVKKRGGGMMGPKKKMARGGSAAKEIAKTKIGLHKLDAMGMLGAGKAAGKGLKGLMGKICLLYTSPSPRDRTRSRMPSSA